MRTSFKRRKVQVKYQGKYLQELESSLSWLVVLTTLRYVVVCNVSWALFIWRKVVPLGKWVTLAAESTLTSFYNIRKKLTEPAALAHALVVSPWPSWPGWASQNRDLKMRGRRKQVKRRLKSEFAVFQSSSRLFHLAYFVESTRTLLELKSKSLIQVKKVHKRQRNVQKSVMHVQSCCFAY